jgi:endonuclease YncB( thermonuclease family)
MLFRVGQGTTGIDEGRADMRKLAILALVLTACAPEPEAPTRGEPGTVSGSARVVDGDTLYVDGVKFRLNGVDAPERGEVATGNRAKDLALQTPTPNRPPPLTSAFAARKSTRTAA